MVYSTNYPISNTFPTGWGSPYGQYTQRGLGGPLDAGMYTRPMRPSNRALRQTTYGYPTQQPDWTTRQNYWPTQSQDSYSPQRGQRSRKAMQAYDNDYDTGYGAPSAYSQARGGYTAYPGLEEMDSWSPSSRGPSRSKAVGNDEFAEKAADTLYTILRHNPSLGRTLQETLGITPEMMEEIQSTAHNPLAMRKYLYQVLAETPSGRKVQRILNSNKWGDKIKQKAIKMAVQQATPDEYDKEVASWLKEFKDTKPKPKPISFDPFSTYGLSDFY